MKSEGILGCRGYTVVGPGRQRPQRQGALYGYIVHWRRCAQQDDGTGGGTEPEDRSSVFGPTAIPALREVLGTIRGPFYFGNLLMASDPDLNLAFASDWTKDGTTIEVNNPTDKEITATITTPKAITDRKAVKEQVTVPAGASVIVEVK